MPPAREIHIPERELRYLYLEAGLTLESVAKRQGCSAETVRRRLAECGIHRRKGWRHLVKWDVSPRELRELYLGKCMTAPEIAQLLRIGHSEVYYWLRRYHLPIRSRSEGKKGRSNGLEGKPRSAETREKISKTVTKLWRRPDFVQRLQKGLKRRPTTPEIKLHRILDSHFAGEFVYNGDFGAGVLIGGLVPDFVNCNGHKLAIDVFGDYWHKPAEVPTRREIFARYGWQLIVLWESEINTLPEGELVKKINVNVPYAIV